MNHRHKADPSMRQDLPYFISVAESDRYGVSRQNQRAHGNIIARDECKCGAVRLTNVNGRHIERGPWLDNIS